MNYRFTISSILITLFSTFLIFSITGCDEERTPTSTPYEPPERTISLDDAQWPLSKDRELNSDISYAQFGPRSLPSGYDFHAGIDLAAPTGTNVYPVLPGEVVEVDEWDGTSTGAGNAITIKHSDSLATSYLHLEDMLVTVGEQVSMDDVIATVGATGASYPHLHLGYFVELPNPNSRDERYSKNPLEILPYDDSQTINYDFRQGGEIVLDMPVQSMTATSIELIGAGENETLKADYYNIVSRGWTPRKDPVQNGIRFDAARRTSDHMRFDLTVKPLNMGFIPQRVIVKDYKGEVLLDATRD